MDQFKLKLKNESLEKHKLFKNQDNLQKKKNKNKNSGFHLVWALLVSLFLVARARASLRGEASSCPSIPGRLTPSSPPSSPTPIDSLSLSALFRAAGLRVASSRLSLSSPTLVGSLSMLSWYQLRPWQYSFSFLKSTVRLLFDMLIVNLMNMNIAYVGSINQCRFIEINQQQLSRISTNGS